MSRCPLIVVKCSSDKEFVETNFFFEIVLSRAVLTILIELSQNKTKQKQEEKEEEKQTFQFNGELKIREQKDTQKRLRSKLELVLTTQLVDC